MEPDTTWSAPRWVRSGCWGHRENILANPAAHACPSGQRSYEVMGVAVDRANAVATSSIDQLFVDECGALPTDVVYSWTDARRALGLS